MTIALWTLQILLALHTAIGAFWKLGNSAAQVPSLSPIPSTGWLALAGVEMICAALLLLPLWKGLAGGAVPAAAIVIAAEMAGFILLHLRAGAAEPGPPLYWAVVMGLCLLLAALRLWVAPL